MPWVSFQQEWISAAGLALIGFAALTIPPRRQDWPWISLFALTVACVPLVQLLFGQIRFLGDGVLASLYVGGFSLAIVAGSSFARLRSDDFLTGLFVTCLVAGVVSVGLAATQWLQLGPVSYVEGLARGGRAYGNLAQPNHLAGLLALSMVSLLWLFETRRVGVGAAWLAAAWLGAGVVMTQSRTGWLFVIAIAASACWVRRRTTTRLSLPSLASGVVAFFVMVAAFAPLSELLLISSQALGDRIQPGTRLTNWGLLAGAALQAPWTGYGWTQVPLATQAAALHGIFPEAMVLNGHNLILDLVLWNGLPLGLAIAGVLTWWLAWHYWHCQTVEQWLLLLGVTSVVLHALLEYPLEYAYFLLPLGLFVGALEGISSQPKTLRVSGAVYATLLLGATALLAWTGVEYMKVEESARQIRFVLRGIGLDKAPTAPPPDVRLLTAPREFHRFLLAQAGPGMSTEELDWMRRVMERYPSPPTQLRYALAAGLNGRAQEAADTLVRICFMHTAPRCSEGLASWRALQEQHPALRKVPFPTRALTAMGIAH